jgi:hypothetical protein
MKSRFTNGDLLVYYRTLRSRLNYRGSVFMEIVMMVMIRRILRRLFP